MQKTRVLIADDHSVVRTGLAAILSFEKDLEVVGEAEDGLKAVHLARRLKPDIVIMDLMMPVLDGVGATLRIAAEAPATKVLILTSYGSALEIRKALDAGARGLSNDDIAQLLGISTSAVKQRLTVLFAKLGAANRTEAAAIALKKQLLKL